MAGGRMVNEGPRNSTLAVFGDSLAEGMNYAQARNQLPEGMRNFNGSFAIGEHSNATLARLRASNPPPGSTVVVFVGTNDLIGIGAGVLRSPERAVGNLKRNIAAMEDWARGKGVNLIFTTVPPCSSHRSIHNAGLQMPQATVDAMKGYNEWLLSRQREGVRVIDLSFMARTDGQGRRTFEMSETYAHGSDGLHPNATGYVEIAKRIVNPASVPETHAQMQETEGRRRIGLSTIPRRKV